jgi:hypothetical protein
MDTKQSAAALQDEFISIMTDPDLHPLPITPNDPLSIVSSYFIFSLITFCLVLK